MTNRHENKEECAWFSKLLTEESEETISSGQCEFRKKHMEVCEECRREAMVYGLMRFDGTSGPAESWNDIQTHRWIDEILGKAEEPAHLSKRDDESRQEAGGEHTGQSSSRGAAHSEEEAPIKAASKKARWLALAGVGVVLVVMGGLLLWRLATNNPQDPKEVVTGPEVVLVSGDVRSQGDAVSLGQVLGPSRTLEVQEGRLVLRLPDGSVVLVEPGSLLEIDTASERWVKLGVRHGEVVCQVTPSETRERFVVRTSKMRVDVKGTVFHVIAGGPRHEVAVQRGRVVASLRGTPEGSKPGEGPSGDSLDVRSGERAEVSEKNIKRYTLGPGQASNIKKRVELIALLRAQAKRSERVRVHLETTPSRAQVWMDGTFIGETPLLASLHPGFRMMTVRKEGYSPVREGVDLRNGVPMTREFELKREEGVCRGCEVVGARVAQQQRGEDKRADAHADGRISEGPENPPHEPRRRGQARPPGVVRPQPQRDVTTHHAKTLLIKAQKASGSGDYKKAVRAYTSLVRRYPKRPEAAPALVSMGRLLLGPVGRPKAALQAFEKYLSSRSGGGLAQEASYGRLRALRALGKKRKERVALERFLKRFPGAVQRVYVEKRLQELKGKNPRAKDRNRISR